MQKILIAISALFCFASCSTPTRNSTKTDDKAQKNLESGRVISKAFETGNTALLDSAVADNFLDHTDQGDKTGRDSLKSMVNYVHTSMKDMKMETIREVADDDYVFQWMRYTGTSDGSMGMPAGPFDMHAIEVSKYKDGKAVEHWSYMNMKEMMKMMPQPAPKMMDSSMKKK